MLALAVYLALAGASPLPRFELALASHGRPSRHSHRVVHRIKAEPPVRMDQIGITGQSTEYDGLAHSYTIDGHVKIILRDMSVTCDHAIISTSADEDHVEKILFFGNVVAVRARNTFRGDRVTYFVASKRLLAQGNTRTKVLLPRSGNASLQQSLEPSRPENSQ